MNGDGKGKDESDQVLKFGQILCETPESYPSRDAEYILRYMCIELSNEVLARVINLLKHRDDFLLIPWEEISFSTRIV